MHYGKEKIANIVSTQKHIININGISQEICNTNELLGVLEGVNGVKTGFTNNAGRCLVTSVNRDGMEIIVVVLRSDTKNIRTKDSIKIIEYIYKNFLQINIEKKVEEKFDEWIKINIQRVCVNKGINKNIKYKLSDIKNPIITVKNYDVDNINIEVYTLFYFEAPLNKNTIIGKVNIIFNEEVIEVLDLYNINVIEKKSNIIYMKEFLKVFNN